MQVSLQAVYSASFVLDFVHCKFALGSLQCNSRVKSRDCYGQLLNHHKAMLFAFGAF